MKNMELIQNYNALVHIQKREKEYYEKNGKQLLGGRIGILYAMKKNMKEILDKLDPYQESLNVLKEEYRDQEKEEAVYQEAMRQYRENHEKGSAPEMNQIFRKEKDREVYEEKIKELLDIDVQDISIQKVNIEALDGLELSSEDLDAFMFMLIEE